MIVLRRGEDEGRGTNSLEEESLKRKERVLVFPQIQEGYFEQIFKEFFKIEFCRRSSGWKSKMKVPVEDIRKSSGQSIRLIISALFLQEGGLTCRGCL